MPVMTVETALDHASRDSLRGGWRDLPSHIYPTSPQMKSLQWWQKVGLVRVTLRKECPWLQTGCLEREPGDCGAFLLPELGLELPGISPFLLPPAGLSPAGFVRAPSAIASSVPTEEVTLSKTIKTRKKKNPERATAGCARAT